MSRSGISRKTATALASHSSDDITPAKTGDRSLINLLAPENASSFGQTQQTLFSSGDMSDIASTVRKGSTVQSSETRARTDRLSLSDRLTQSLITAGLIKGITPSLIRGMSGAAIRDFASLPLDGGAAVDPKKVYLFSRDEQGSPFPASPKQGGAGQ